MRWLLAVDQTTLFGAIAAFSTLLGIAMAILSHIQGRKAAERKAEAETHEELLAVRREAEELSAELHRLKMEHPDEFE